MFKQGKWYASITVDCVPTPLPSASPTSTTSTERRDSIVPPAGGIQGGGGTKGGGAIGIDFGVYHAASFSDGTIIDNPRFIKQSQEKINRLSKKSRRKKAPNFKKRIRASRRWKKANRAVSKIQTKVARQRPDWQHKLATEIVSCNSLVATEKLNLKNLTKKAKKGSKRKRQKTGLNRSLLDVGIGNLKSLIKYKTTEVGGIYIEVPTRKLAPSQTCPGCGIKRKKSLSERFHICDCGIPQPLDRDVAAAMVMLNYARGLGTSLQDAESPSSTSCTKDLSACSMKQLGAKKRRKLAPNL